jgi:hypothetical protein
MGEKEEVRSDETDTSNTSCRTYLSNANVGKNVDGIVARAQTARKRLATC